MKTCKVSRCPELTTRLFSVAQRRSAAVHFLSDVAKRTTKHLPQNSNQIESCFVRLVLICVVFHGLCFCVFNAHPLLICSKTNAKMMWTWSDGEVRDVSGSVKMPSGNAGHFVDGNVVQYLFENETRMNFYLQSWKGPHCFFSCWIRLSWQLLQGKTFTGT